jgi:hypothetical protein
LDFPCLFFFSSFFHTRNKQQPLSFHHLTVEFTEGLCDWPKPEQKNVRKKKSGIEIEKEKEKSMSGTGL